MVKKCPNCNHYLSDTVKSCSHCGMNLDADSYQSTKEKIAQSEILSKLNELKRPDGIFSTHFCVLEGKIAFALSNCEIQIFISSQRHEDGEELFQKTKNAYKKFKQSSFFSEFNFDEDSCDDNTVELLSDGNLKKEDVIQYVVDLLRNVFNISSLNQIEFLDIETKTSKGCLGVVFLFIVCSLTASLLIINL